MISIHAPREGGDPESWAMPRSPGRFQSTPPARGATALALQIYDGTGISIHAPREGGDDQFFREHGKVCAAFQSTPPARGATQRSTADSNAHMNFNPRPPRGGRPTSGVAYAAALPDISIHAPREGGDAALTVPMTATSIFQSTPPARGATFNRLKTENPTEISIHAPREGGDCTRR